MVEHGLGRVQVLGLVVAQGAGAEAQHAAALVDQREHEAAAEAVVDAALLAGHDEAGVGQLAFVEALLHGRVAQVSPAGQREAEAILAADGLGQATAGEVVAGGLRRPRLP